MTDLIIIAILLIVVGSAIFYIVQAKKKGAKCIGCPMAGSCPGRNGSKKACGCGSQNDTK